MSDITFDRILQHTLEAEGGYVFDPADPGGETILGVSRRAHPQWSGWELVDQQKPQPIQVTPALWGAARVLYHDEYWVPIQGQALLAQSGRIAQKMFDTAVNMGIGTASRFLRRALRALVDPEIAPTGPVDMSVLGALKQWLTRRGRDGEAVLLALLNAFQAVRYVEIVEGRPASRRFLFGWIRKRVLG